MTNPRTEAMKEAAQASEEVDVNREAQPTATDIEYMDLKELWKLEEGGPVRRIAFVDSEREAVLLAKIQECYKRIAELEAALSKLEAMSAAVVHAYFSSDDVPHLHPSVDELRRVLSKPPYCRKEIRDRITQGEG